MMRTTWMVACAATVLVGQAQAQIADDAKAALTESAKAIQDTKGVTFSVKRTGTSLLKDILDVTGDVKLMRVDGATSPMWMIDGRAKQPGKPDKKIMVVTDGRTVRWVDYEKNTYYERPAADPLANEPLKLAETVLNMQDWVTGKPYEQSMRMDTMTKTGTSNVGGVVCDDVEVSMKGQPRRTIWSLGAADKLPRRMEQASGDGANKIAMITEVSNLKVAPLTAKDFEIKVPEGFTRSLQNEPMNPATGEAAPPPPADIGLKTGVDAPPFSAEGADGKAVALDGMKGSAVVLEFWGPMFKQSVQNMEKTKAFASGASASGIKVVSIACRDGAGQASKIWETAGRPYPLITKGDSIAENYKVAGFPTYVVINKSGKISGFYQEFPGAEALTAAANR